MSRLAERIRKTSRVEAAHLGFGPAVQRATNATMLAGARVETNEASKTGDAAARGADFVIVDGGDAGKLKDHRAKAGDVIIGARVEKADRNAVRKLVEAGADFIVLDAATGLAEATLEDKPGYALVLSGEEDDTRLRLLSELGLEALIVDAPESPVTIERMLRLRRIAALARTPLLVEADGNSDASLLQVLRDSGAAGVIVTAGAIGKVAELREKIAALPARGKKRYEERSEATIPAAVMAGHDHDDDDYDD